MEAVGNTRAYLLAIVVVPFLGTVSAMGLLWQRAVRLSDLVLLLAMYTVTCFGLTIGFHRMLTHRSFRSHPAMKFLLLVLGSMALVGSPIEWAATHLKHHSQSDREGDPHSPTEGLFHSHIGWLFKDRFADPATYCRHLLEDPIVTFVKRTFLLWVLLSLAILLVIGGWTGLLWGGLVRICIGQHVAFAVNSICHRFGGREFETSDHSRNHWGVALLAFGEGWHNNHHAFPRSAFHGFHRWQFDLAGAVIWMLERIGLAHDVYRVSPALLARGCSRS